MSDEPKTVTFELSDRFYEAIAAFEEAKDAGSDPSLAEWQAKYPDLADQLAHYFADQQRLRAVLHKDAAERDAKGTTAKGSELAILGPPREPGSLGSLDHYEVLEVVGRGGMGVVFKARDTKLQRIVAIKVLASHLAADGTSRKRFVREAQAAAAIRDTHVVGIHAVSDDGTVPYLVMEFIGGVTLDEQIKANGPPTLKEILRIGMQAAEGLAAAHRQGLIHRDVKPANLLLENGVQRVKIADFGLARAGDNASLTQSGMIAGTPLYMSPEQTRGEALDCRSDLFSLGSVLYFVCTGAAAFAASNTMGVLKRIQEETPRPIRSINSDIPDWLAAIVDKLLAKDPKDRFQSAVEVAELLGEHWLGFSIRERTAPPVPPVQGKRRWIGIAAACGFGASLLLLIIYAASVGLKPSEQRPPGSDILPIPTDQRVLTVSQKKEDGGEFRTINEALVKVRGEKKIIRVVDDAAYEEQIRINEPDRFRGLVLEAAKGKKPTLRVPANFNEGPPFFFCVGIENVGNVTVRGFQIDAAKVDQVYVTGVSAGTNLENIEFVGNQNAPCVEMTNLDLSPQDVPVQIQNCIFQKVFSLPFMLKQGSLRPLTISVGLVPMS